TDRTFTPNSTAVPVPGLPGPRPCPVVAVLGHPGRVAALGPHLPSGWALRSPGTLEEVRPGELVLLSGATEAGVLAARAALPRRTLIVALVDDHARAQLVAAVLSGGAEVCVRGGLPAILAS